MSLDAVSGEFDGQEAAATGERNQGTRASGDESGGGIQGQDARRVGRGDLAHTVAHHRVRLDARATATSRRVRRPR